jgi:phosphatidylglycerophosphate synthase
MEKFWNSLVEKFRHFRSRKFSSRGRFFLKIGITANLMTALSLICGILAAYFVFQDYWLFILFAALHYLADGLDGMIARAARPTLRGKYFDYFSDRTVKFLLLLRIWQYLNYDYFVLIVLILYLVAQTIYVYSGFTYPILFTRSFTLLFLALNWPTIAYLVTGVAALYSLALQLKKYLEEH